MLRFASCGGDKLSPSDAAFMLLKLQDGFMRDEGCALEESFLLFKPRRGTGKECIWFKCHLLFKVADLLPNFLLSALNFYCCKIFQ